MEPQSPSRGKILCSSDFVSRSKADSQNRKVLTKGKSFHSCSCSEISAGLAYFHFIHGVGFIQKPRAGGGAPMRC